MKDVIAVETVNDEGAEVPDEDALNNADEEANLVQTDG